MIDPTPFQPLMEQLITAASRESASGGNVVAIPVSAIALAVIWGAFTTVKEMRSIKVALSAVVVEVQQLKVAVQHIQTRDQGAERRERRMTRRVRRVEDALHLVKKE